MNVPTKITAAITLLLIAAPVAQSSWSAAGNIEPSTPYDTETLMWPTAPGPGSNRIYFNAFASIAPAGVAAVSPNVALLGTQNEVPTNEYHMAVFGVWKDCNGDGYIGMAESGLREYSARLLLDDSVCPATPGLGNTWIAGAHNYRGWVTEYVPIGQNASSSDTRVYNDNEAMVWGDYGRPDQAAFFRSCALYPQPRGTYQSTGGALNFVECRLEQNGFDGLGTFNAAMAAVNDPLALSGDDADGDDWRTSGLEMRNPAGSEDTQYSPATVWDCDSSTADDPTTGESLVPGIDPQVGNTDGPALAALVNHTIEGVYFYDDGAGSSDCDTSNDAGHDFYGNNHVFQVGETDFNGVSPKNKHESDWNLDFTTVARGTAPFGVALGTTGSSGAPGTDAGVAWTTLDGSGWGSPSVYGSKPGFRTVRAHLDGDNPAASSAGVADAWWLSFYAHVGKATKDRGLQLPGGSGEYASVQCGSQETGISMGWNCDVSTWYVNPDGSTMPEPYPSARPGQAYELIDVDCYDGRVGGTGVGAQPAFYGDNPCP